MKKLLLSLFFAIAALQPLSAEEAAPQPITTRHQLPFEKDPFAYTALLGSLPVRQGKETSGHIHYIFYQKEEADSTRPITFVFNGGPGSSSVWLHLGAFGPKRPRTPEEGQSPVPPYILLDNPHSILDLTDLVFIDPVGTGFSRPCGEGDGASFYDMQGDIESIGDFVCDFVTRHGRWNSPKFVAGESYGALRACGLSNYLIERHDIYLNGAILISGALDFKTLSFERDNELPFTLYLPSYAATAWAHGRLPGMTLEEVVAGAHEFAMGTFAAELLKTGSVPPHLYPEIAIWTGLSIDTVAQANGLISEDFYLTHFGASEKKLLGLFDSRCIGDRLSAGSRFNLFEDPSWAAIGGIMTASLNHYLYQDLKCRTEWPRYEILSTEANQKWRFDAFGYPNQLEGLRKALLVNPNMRVFSASGYFDLAVPFSAAEYCMQRLHLPRKNNLAFGYYEGGHMFYTNPAALKQFKADLVKFYADALRNG